MKYSNIFIGLLVALAISVCVCLSACRTVRKMIYRKTEQTDSTAFINERKKAAINSNTTTTTKKDFDTSSVSTGRDTKVTLVKEIVDTVFMISGDSSQVSVLLGEEERTDTVVTPFHTLLLHRKPSAKTFSVKVVDKPRLATIAKTKYVKTIEVKSGSLSQFGSSSIAATTTAALKIDSQASKNTRVELSRYEKIKEGLKRVDSVPWYIKFGIPVLLIAFVVFWVIRKQNHL